MMYHKRSVVYIVVLCLAFSVTIPTVLFAQDDSAERGNIAKRIAETGVYSDSDIHSLISWLSDRTRIIEKGKQPLLPPPPLTRLRDETTVSEQAEKALVAIGPPAIPFLVAALSDDRETLYTHAKIVTILSEIGGVKGAEASLEYIKRKTNGHQAVDTEISLAWLGDSVVSILIEALNSDVSDLKIVAARELGEIGGPLAQAELLRELEDLRKKITKERPADWDPKHNIIVFRNAIFSYAKISGKSAFEFIKRNITQLYPCWDSKTNEAMILSLGWVKDERTLPLLLPLLKNGKYYERQYAAKALMQLKNSEAAEALTVAFGDQDRIVRQYAAKTLGLLKYKSAIPNLLELSKIDTDQEVREAAKRAAQMINNE